jgi:hypothetical protein
LDDDDFALMQSPESSPQKNRKMTVAPRFALNLDTLGKSPEK